MLVPVLLPFYDGKEWFKISRISGVLSASDQKPFSLPWEPILRKQINSVLNCCDNPFECQIPAVPMYQGFALNSLVKQSLVQISDRMLALGNMRFFQSIAFASQHFPLFDSTADAFEAITQHTTPHSDLHFKYCFQRALTVAKVSRSFWSTDSAILIGAFLDTGEMHAWIIESRNQPDPYDRVWVNYRPLLALVPVRRFRICHSTASRQT